MNSLNFSSSGIAHVQNKLALGEEFPAWFELGKEKGEPRQGKNPQNKEKKPQETQTITDASFGIKSKKHF